jgi:hypothetical protein
MLKQDSRGIDIVIVPYHDAHTAFETSQRVRGPDEQTKDIFSYLSPEARPSRPSFAPLIVVGR